jgi:hypothetical protein
MGDDFAFLKNVSMRVREPRVPAHAHSGEVLAVRLSDSCKSTYLG